MSEAGTVQPPEASWRQAMLIQLQVVHALLLRETKTRFGTHQLGYLWALIEVMLWLGVFWGLYYGMGRKAPTGMSLIPFLVTGIVPFFLFRETADRCSNAISGNKGLLYYPQVQPLDLVLSRVTLEFATKVVVFAIMVVPVPLYEGNLRVDSALQIVGGLVLASGLGAGVGLVFCGLGVFSETILRLQGTLLRPLFWLSGLFFLVDALPTRAREFVLYNPVLHVVELVRGGWFTTYESRYVNAWYPALWVIVLLFFGLTLERVARRRWNLA